jgi:hypothetical protein
MFFISGWQEGREGQAKYSYFPMISRRADFYLYGTCFALYISTKYNIGENEN